MALPRLVVSTCLLGKKTRYNGEILQCPLLQRLISYSYIEIVPVCPEVSIGLPIPRRPINIIKKRNRYLAIEEETNRDLTPSLIKFSISFLKGMDEVDGFFLKSRSPSCGYSGTKVYADETKKVLLGRGKGIFARQISRVLPEIPIEDEERLSHFYIRHHYFTRIFIIHNLHAKSGCPINTLLGYHRRIRSLLYAYNPGELKDIEKSLYPLLSSHQGARIYFHRIKRLLSCIPSVSSYFNSILKFYGSLIQSFDNRLYRNIKEGAQKGEEERLKEVLERIREICQKGAPFLQQEAILFPYPGELFY